MSLEVGSRILSVAEIGPSAAQPMVGALLETPYRISASDPGDIPPEIIRGCVYGNPANLYPYQEQNDYGRALVETPVRTVVLENSRLRAVFLPEWGGRLWEIFDKASGKHLLHSPDTIQLANLGLRNAWFAGGIEWNIGTRGHSPTTASALHAAIVRAPEGHDILRMWEFDRLREVVFQIDAWLPEDSPVLLVAVRVRNPNSTVVPMYWWTNAAVPQGAHTRVLAPADSAFASADEGGISRIPVVSGDGGQSQNDWSWPTRNQRARDFFFDIPPTQRRWILSSDAEGDGLAMLSTIELRGRKLFVWGQGPGGSRWQRWLTPRGGDYAEIQTGLAQTQFQHLEMPAGAEWSWVEAYGNAGLSPAIAHGSDWTAAVAHAEQRLATLADVAVLEAAHAAARSWADLAPRQHVLAGSGWGFLEAMRRSRRGACWIDETGTPFVRESITAEQRPWLDLLEGATVASETAASEPVASGPDRPGFVAGEDWEALCVASGDSAESCLQRAIMRHAAGDLTAAEDLYRASLSFASTASAHRGLALLRLSRDTADGIDHYRRACAHAPDDVALVVEAATAVLGAGAPEIALEMLAPVVGNTGARQGRVQLLTAQGLARIGHTEAAAGILRHGIVVSDLREGENAMAALWREVIPGDPVPAAYQFSMTEGERP